MTRPSHGTPGGHAYLQLQRLARASGRGTQSLLVWYVHERFLFRASMSPHRERLILKGGMLLAALGQRRATQDIDVLARDVEVEHAVVAQLVADIARVEVDDGVRYDIDQLRTEDIREDELYGGVRVAMPAHIDRSNVTFRLDLNVGDPVTPGPVDVDYPSLLGGSFKLRAYPISTVLAEKVVTMMERGETNTRERDVADVIVLARRYTIDNGQLTAAITATAAHRGVAVRPLRDVIGELGSLRQSAWEAFVRRAELDVELPSSYRAALDEFCRLVDSLLWPPPA